MRAPAALLAALLLAGCFGADVGACEQRTGAGVEVAVQVVWNATAAPEPVGGACVQAYPPGAGQDVDRLRVEGRADAVGQATLRLGPEQTWRVFARIGTPEDKACGWWSQTVELQPKEPTSVELRVDRTQKVCA